MMSILGMFVFLCTALYVHVHINAYIRTQSMHVRIYMYVLTYALCVDCVP